jgi:hypothetical protein
MDKTQIITLILGSAAVGALVSSLMTAWTTHLERRARREELIFTKALEMTHKRIDTLTKAFEMSNYTHMELPPEMEMASKFHKALSHLFKHGEVNPEMLKEIEGGNFLNKAP